MLPILPILLSYGFSHRFPSGAREAYAVGPKIRLRLRWVPFEPGTGIGSSARSSRHGRNHPTGVRAAWIGVGRQR